MQAESYRGPEPEEQVCIGFLQNFLLEQAAVSCPHPGSCQKMNQTDFQSRPSWCYSFM